TAGTPHRQASDSNLVARSQKYFAQQLAGGHPPAGAFAPSISRIPAQVDGVAPPRLRTVSRRAAGLGAVGLTVLTVAMTWPIAAELSTHGLSHMDVALTVWIVTWVARTVVTAPT